jgi:peptide chain release factor 1
MDYQQKLQQTKQRFEELNQQLSDPSVFDDPKAYAELTREHTQLKNLVEEFDRWSVVHNAITEHEELIAANEDPELTDLAHEELKELKPELASLEESLQEQLIPKDPEDSKNCIVEIRAGTGGDEAAIFTGDLYDMYRRYADDMGWSQSILSLNYSEKGGFKEVVFSLQGGDAFGQMKYESGVHRVQRVPETESQGRVHTSAATVAVLPEADEVDVHIDPKDLRIDTFRSSGAGGQHVNKTDSAIRITHVPSGMVAECQEERSQHKNKDKALIMLRSRMFEQELEKQRAQREAHRRSQVSTGDRSAKIRTYNFPQGRMTDHRISLTLYNLDDIMKGDLRNIIKSLRMHDHLEKMQQIS